MSTRCAATTAHPSMRQNSSAPPAPPRRNSNRGEVVSTLPARTADMQALPTPEAFAKAYAGGEPQVVWTRLVADLETPVSVYLKLAQGGPMSFLLESVEGGAARGRYSVIGL